MKTRGKGHVAQRKCQPTSRSNIFSCTVEVDRHEALSTATARTTRTNASSSRRPSSPHYSDSGDAESVSSYKRAGSGREP